MFPARTFLRARTLVLALILVFAFTWSYAHWQDFPFPEQDHPAQSETGTVSDKKQTGKWRHNPEGHIEFWRKFQPLLTTHQPKCEPPLRLGSAPSIRFEQSNPEDRPELLDMLPFDVDAMRNAHSGFVDAINAHPPQLNYTPNTRGLVSTAGGSYLPVLVISLRMLRRTGSKLPVEVFLANDDEYEDHICDVVLPSLNARCVVMSEILDAVSGTMEIQKYQFKLFAMLFSSFEEILFLDADAFPLQQPELLFTSEPFASTHMVTWPDFWASTISSYYYEISSQPYPETAVRQSSESGEVLISKKTHLKTLLLSTYYNVWGPDFYYPLLSQGAAGEGDKETFIAAASRLQESYYQVSEPICAIGHGTEGGLAGSAMVQFDPMQDFALTRKGEWRVHGSTAPAPRAFFVHANYPKFNPATVFEKQAVNPAYADDGSYTRAWTIPEDVIKAFGSDVEKGFWEEILWTACELEDKFGTWKDERGVCLGVKNYWNAMFGIGHS
ncbi:nucleotide-diphospho-sugar transferase [Aspergillus heteromorphus CBS 117.55]|uniref:Nucleotide-diphospho-sugar transferase n=1 Tax=Aspergillus heteromorphus CBS 117.55 TaxID=1448321 RepID=A0A317WAR1_9EURO|nr:nucleotide-diphospho-sugar transferase [Aspergillus heteromorphus CBS 117.55]PWY82985.1 nucleotide-diphospho-sugar transferase [Aspergillus heteromorphus CBS 117.55]